MADPRIINLAQGEHLLCLVLPRAHTEHFVHKCGLREAVQLQQQLGINAGDVGEVGGGQRVGRVVVVHQGLRVHPGQQHVRVQQLGGLCALQRGQMGDAHLVQANLAQQSKL